MLFFIVLVTIVIMVRSGFKVTTAFLTLIGMNFVYLFAVIDFLMASSISHYLLFTEDHIETGRFLVFLVSSALSIVLCAGIYWVYRFFR